MNALIWVDDELWRGDVLDGDVAFLRDEIDPVLQPLADDAYKDGPAGILQTEARFSYLLGADHVYWLVEWQPDLLVIWFSASGAMAWARVPGPTGSDEDRADDPRYRLVFGPWDAQFDPVAREWGAYGPASAEVRERWEAAMAHANELSAQIEAAIGDDEDAFVAWQQRCEQSPFWEGVA